MAKKVVKVEEQASDVIAVIADISPPPNRSRIPHYKIWDPEETRHIMSLIDRLKNTATLIHAETHCYQQYSKRELIDVGNYMIQRRGNHYSPLTMDCNKRILAREVYQLAGRTYRLDLGRSAGKSRVWVKREEKKVGEESDHAAMRSEADEECA